MNCRVAKAQWHARLDEGATNPALEQHLAECDACRTYASQMSRLANVLDELRVESEQVVVRADRPAAPGPGRAGVSPRWVAGVRLLGAAAAVVILLTGGLYFSGFWTATDTASRPGPNAAARADHEASIPTVRLRGDSAAKYLPVVRATSDANVQMIWLYPTLSTVGNDDRS